nr:hypothetical protein [Tanacetum cinerariifolium]
MIAITFVGLEELMNYFDGVCFEIKLKAYMDMMLFPRFQGGENKSLYRKRMNDGPTDFVSGLNLRTRPPTMRSLIADAPIMTIVVTATIVVYDSAVSKVRVEPENLEIFGDFASSDGDNTNVTNDSFLDDLYVCRDLMDRLAPPFLFSQLRAMDYDQLYVEFNVRAARQMCLGAEVRIRVEYTLEQKDKLEEKCPEQAAFLSEKDVEISNLKYVLSVKEAEATEAIRLYGQLSIVETVDAAKSNELRGLKGKNLVLEEEKSVLSEKLSRDELSSKVAFLESERDRISDQTEAIGCTINKGMQDGLKAGIDHGKDRRDSSVIEAYNPFAKAKYVDTVNALHTVDLFFLSVLRSKKDACMADLMDSLRLEGPLADIPRAEELQPSLEHLTLHVHRAGDNVVLGDTSLSFSFQVVHSRVQRVRGEIMDKCLSLTDVVVPLAEPLSSKSLIGEASTFAILATAEPIATLFTTFASSGVIPPLLESNYQVLDAEPHDEDPPAITFKEKELGTTPEAGDNVVLGDTSLSFSFQVVHSRVQRCACSGLTQRSHGLRKDFCYNTPFVMAYLPVMRRMALAFLFSSSIISFVRWAKLVDAILLSAFAFLLSPLASNLNLRAYVNSAPFRSVIISLAPEPSVHNDQSVNNTHGSGSSSLSSMGIFGRFKNEMGRGLARKPVIVEGVPRFKAHREGCRASRRLQGERRDAINTMLLQSDLAGERPSSRQRTRQQASIPLFASSPPSTEV